MCKEVVGEEELTVKKGAYVRIDAGRQKGLYGQVEGFDDDGSRAFLRLSEGGSNASVPTPVLTAVTKKEFKDSKVLNRDMMKEYEEKQRERQVEWDRGREERDRTLSNGNDKKRRRSRTPEKSKKSKSSSSSAKYSSNRRRWVRSNLRVRFIDEKYKKGRYYNTKMVVEDVVTADSCTCRTDDGRVLEDIRPDYLETVIPKGEGALVMILAIAWSVQRRRRQLSGRLDGGDRT